MDIVKRFSVFHDKVVLLANKRCSEWETRNRHHRIFRKVLPTITHKIFETNSSFHLKERTTGKV